MNLATLRVLVVENLPGLKIGAATVDRLINRAVEHVTNRVELTGNNYNINPTAKTISVTASTQTYSVNPSNTPVIRKIVQVERTDATIGNPVPAIIIPFQHKTRYAANNPWSGGTGGMIRPIVYFTRDNVGIWTMGFPIDPAQSMTIDIYYSPQITELSADTDVPREVPEQHHELIATRTTIMAILAAPPQLKLTTDEWDRQYAEQVQIMQSDLGTWNRTGPRVRRF